MPLEYGDILDQWDRSRAFGDQRDLSTFSRDLNSYTGTNDYDAGINDNWWKRLSARADQQVFHPIAEYTTQPIGAAVGGLFGRSDIGEEVGRELPRTIAQTVPLALADLLPGGALVTAGGALATGALFGAQTYAQTDSVPAAVTSGATAAILPGVSKLAEPILPAVFKATEPFTTKALQFVGRQAAQVGTLEASQAIEAKQTGSQFDPLDPHFWATQIPFTAWDLAHTALHPAVSRPTLEPKPEYKPYEPPEPKAEDAARVEATLSKMEEILGNPTSSPTEREAAVAAALGVSLQPSTTPTGAAKQMVTLVGYARPQDNGNIKMVVNPEASDVPGLREHNNVWINDNPDMTMTNGKNGQVIINTPIDSLNHNVTTPLKWERYAPNPAQPELPTQKNPMGLFPWEMTEEEGGTLKKNEVTVPPDAQTALRDTNTGEVVQGTPGQSHDELLQQHLGTTPEAAEYSGQMERGYTDNKGNFSLEPPPPDTGKQETLKTTAQQLDQNENKIQELTQKAATKPLTQEELYKQVILENNQPLMVTHWTPSEAFDLRQFDVGKSEKHGGTDFGPGVYLEPGNGWRDYVESQAGKEAIALRSFISSEAKVYDFTEKITDEKGNTDLQKHINSPEAAAADVIIHRDETGRISQVFVRDPKFLIPIKRATEKLIVDSVKSDLEDRMKKGASVEQAMEGVRQSLINKQLDAALTTQNILQTKGRAVAARTPRAISGASYKVGGKVVRFDSADKALEFLNAARSADPTIPEHEVASRNTGKPSEYWYLRKREGQKLSLQAERAEEPGATLENIISTDKTVDDLTHVADERSSPIYLPPERRATVSFDHAIRSLDRAISEPAVFANAIGLNGSDPADVIQATRLARQAQEIYRQIKDEGGIKLNELNANLKAIGSTPIASVERAQKILSIVGTGIDEFSDRYSNFTLGSKMPNPNPEAGAKIGLGAGLNEGDVKSILGTYLNLHEDTFGRGTAKGELLNVLLNAPAKGEIKITSDPKLGWTYHDRGLGVPAEINIPEHITNENFHDWMDSLSHEYTHHIFRELEDRTDPAAMRFKASTREVIDAVRKNAAIPQKVKEAITRSLNEGWYKQWVTDHDAEAFTKKWNSVTGGKYNDWHDVFYAMQNEHELIAKLFESPKLVQLLRETKMPRQPVTILQHFARLWNLLIGGSKFTEDAFTRLISRADNYLSGKTVGPVRQSPIMNIAGRKDTLLRDDRAAAIVGSFARDHDVVDAFGGTGQVSTFSKEMGAKSTTLNIRDPEMRAVVQDLMHDPQGFASRLANAVEPIRVGRREPIIPEVTTGESIHDYLDNLAKKDPNVALLIKQNLQNRGREVEEGKAFTPTNQITTTGLQDLPNRIEGFARRIDRLTGEDGWKIVARTTADSPRVVVDPPYVGQGGFYKGVGKITVEKQLSNYNEFLYPAVERGGKFLVFDIADPRLMKDLQDHGFTVETVQRPGSGGLKSQEELIAYNHPMENLRDFHTYNGRDYLRDSLTAAGVNSNDLLPRLSAVEKLFGTGNLEHSVQEFQRSRTANQGERIVYPQNQISRATPLGLHDMMMNLLAADLPRYNDMYNQLRTDVETAKDLYRNIKQGTVPGEVNEVAFRRLQDASVKLNAMKRALNKQTTALKQFNNLANFTTTGMLDTFNGQLEGRRLPQAPDPTGLEDEAHVALGIAEGRRASSRAELEKTTGARIKDFIIRNLMLTQYSKLHIPGFGPVADAVAHEQGDAAGRMSRLNFVRGYNPETQQLDKKIINTVIRVEQNPNLARAASDIRRYIQERNRAKQGWSLSDPFVKDVLGRSGDPEAIKTELASELRRRTDYVEQITPAFLAKFNRETVAYAIAARETGMLPDEARKLADRMMSAIAAAKDPNMAAQVPGEFRDLSTKMQPDTFLNAMKLAQGLIDQSQKHIDFMRTTPGYVTEQRFDDHHIVMRTPDDKPYRASFATREAALAKVKELEGKGYKFMDYIPRQDANVVGGLRQEVIDSMKELDAQRLNLLTEALKDKPDLVGLLAPMTQRASDYEASQAAFAPVPGKAAPRRKFIGGREEINMVTNNNMFYNKANNWMRHKLVRATSDLEMLHPDLMSNRASAQYSQQHVENFLSRDNEMTRKLVEATYNWKLAWNFGVNILHGVQSLTSGMGSLIADTGGVGDAFKLTGSAYKSIIKRATTGKWDSKDHEWLANKLASEGHAGIASWNDIYGDELMNMNKISQHNNPFAKTVRGVQSAAKNWTGMFLKFNDQVGALAGFDLARERGMSRDDAFKFAVDVKNRAYYTGGKSQRAVGLWSIKSKPVPQLLSSLQTYTYGWFSQLMSNYIRGFGKPPVGLTAVERSAAKKAFLYQLGAQAVMAGALGLPGVGQGLALAKQATGVDIKAWLRQHLGELFGEDQDNGGLMTQLAMHGLVASFSPIDPSGRHIPTFPFLGISPYKGFDVANLATAPVSAASDIVKGLLAVSRGDMEGASNLLPHVLAGPYELWQGEGDIRDAHGGLTYKMSPTEKVITALGLTPTNVQVAKDTAAAAKQASTAAAREKTHTIDKLATIFRKNGALEGRKALYQYFQDHPDEDQARMVRAISSRVTSQTTPSDWRRNVNSAADLSGLSSRMPSTERQRLETKRGVEQALGLYQRRNPYTERLAQEVDDMLNSDPYQTRADALQELSSNRRARRRYTLLPPEESQ